MKPYADTNFFTRYYLEVPDSEGLGGLAEAAGRSGAGALPVSWFLRMEICNALQLCLFRARDFRQAHVTAEQVSAAMACLREDLKRGALLRAVVLAVSDLEGQFEELSLRHTAKHGFRTYDLVHVASALLLGCDTFWSFDSKATRLAALEGLETI
ncbi:MAG TPA: type II toxin-antitoxin system VapC family toxin [Verrucomicrobiae bacterium]|nr:type II toxin-antitoxin system VapC family toxin [Verrucomicrobiae bacterium]